MRPAGSITIKGAGFSAPDVTVLFQVVHRPGGTYHPVRDMTQATAIVVVPTGCRHEPVDDRFQVLVAQGQVTPGFHAETGGIDMHMKLAASHSRELL